jgi:hypothetical protein
VSIDIAAAIERRRLDEVHNCPVPHCNRRAGSAFHVDAPMRLAGRDWSPGEFVDLCPGHELELRRAVSEAAALGYGGPFDRPESPLTAKLAAMDILEDNPVDRLREWAP